MIEAVQAAIAELQPVKISAIAEHTGADRLQVRDALRYLKEFGSIIQEGHSYRIASDGTSNDAEVHDRLAKNGTDTSAVTEPFTICKPEDFEPEHPALQAIDRLSGDLEELENRRSTPAVSDKELKLEVLARLSLILADDVGEVLNSIAEDLDAV